MDQLWAPWRLGYVAAPKSSPNDPSCFICSGLASSEDRANLIVRRTRLSVIMLNKFPYNNGHLLIAPQSHKADLQDLTAEEMLDGLEAVRTCVGTLRGPLRPDGFNIGLNLGKAAGAGLPGHLHWHVVPRWAGDTNFMPVLADVRVIVQSLDSLYDLLLREWQQ